MSLIDPQSELAILRAQRIKAVQECEFKKAREIDNQLQQLKRQIAEASKNDDMLNCQSKYETEKEAVQLEAERVYSESTKQLYEARIKYQKKLTQLHEIHALELQKLAEDYAKDLELATIRQVPDSLVLMNEAKTNALIHRYDEAEYKMERSRNIFKETQEERQADVHLHYMQLKNAVLERQEKENETCKEMYLKAVSSIDRKHQESNSKLQKRLDFRAYSLRSPVETSQPVMSRLVFVDDEVMITAPAKAKSAPVSSLALRRPGLKPTTRPLTPSAKALRNVNRK